MRKKLLWMLSIVLLITLVLATSPVMQTATISPTIAYQNNTLLLYANATDIDGDWLVYLCDILLEGSLNKSIVSTGTQWKENTFRPADDVGSVSTQTIFNLSEEAIFFIAGESDGTFNGFQWNTSGGWDSNVSIVAGLQDVGSNSAPSYCEVDNATYLIAGESDGTFNGFQWNTSGGWFSNSTIVTGLGDVGVDSAPTCFKISNTPYMISGEEVGNLNGFQWNTSGITWFSNSSILTGTASVDRNSRPDAFLKDTDLYLLIGIGGAGVTSGEFEGYIWNETSWLDSTYIESGLTDVGQESAPSAYTKNSSLHLIVGENDGVFTSFLFSDEGAVQLNIANISSSHTTRGQNWSINCTAYDGATFSSWVNSSVLQISNTIPEVNITTLVPSPASPSDDINITYTCYDADSGDTCDVYVEYNWWKNGTSLGINNETLGSGNTSAGSNITGSIRVNDSHSWSEWKNTSTINIGDNESPAISASSLSSSSTYIGTPITIYATCEDTGSAIDYVYAEVNKSATCQGISNESMSLISGDNYSVAYYPPCAGNYQVTRIYCKDSSGNENSTDPSLSFTASTAPSSGGGGGGGTTIIISEKGMFSVTTLGGLTENTDFVVKGIESCLILIVTSLADADQSLEASCESDDKACDYATTINGKFSLKPAQKAQVEVCTTIPKEIRTDGMETFLQSIIITNDAGDKVIFLNTLILGGIQGQLAIAINWFNNTFARSIGWTALSLISWLALTSVFFWITFLISSKWKKTPIPFIILSIIVPLIINIQVIGRL